MLLNHKVLIPAVAGLMLAGAAQAQLLPTWETHITLTQQDLDMIHAVVTNQVHGKPLGTKVSWSNPASGNSGYVKLNKSLVKNGQRCEGRSGCESGRKLILLETSSGKVPKTLLLVVCPRSQSCCCDTINVASAGYATPYEMNQAETRRVGSLWPSLSCADGKSPPQTGSHA
jgi:hypothetical protein